MVCVIIITFLNQMSLSWIIMARSLTNKNHHTEIIDCSPNEKKWSKEMWIKVYFLILYGVKTFWMKTCGHKVNIIIWLRDISWPFRKKNVPLIKNSLSLLKFFNTEILLSPLWGLIPNHLSEHLCVLETFYFSALIWSFLDSGYFNCMFYC